MLTYYKPKTEPFRIFISYTSREEEFAELSPIIIDYCAQLRNWAAEFDVDIFFDKLSIDQKKAFHNKELALILREGIDKCNLFSAFLSPRYTESVWCCMEWSYGAMHRNITSNLRVQSIHWKHSVIDGRTNFADVMDNIKSRNHTDIRYISKQPERYREALYKITAEAKEIIKSNPYFYYLSHK